MNTDVVEDGGGGDTAFVRLRGLVAAVVVAGESEGRIEALHHADRLGCRRRLASAWHRPSRSCLVASLLGNLSDGISVAQALGLEFLDAPMNDLHLTQACVLS